MTRARTDYVRPLDFKHGRVDMTPRQRRPRDGAADRRAVRRAPSTTSGCARATTRRALRGAGGAPGDGHRQPRGLAAVLPRRRHRLPVGARHDQRRGDGGRAAAVPGRRLHPGGRLSARRPEAHRRVDGRRGARGRRADRHRRHQGGRAGQGRRRVHHHHRRRRGAGGRRASPATARGRATRSWSRGTHRRPRRGDHVAAREPDLRDRRSSPTPPRCTAWWRRCSPRCPGIRCLRDPTRGGLATTLNEIARQSGVRHA